MIISRAALDKIKAIIDRNHKALLLTVIGRKVFNDKELRELEALGLDTSNDASLLELVYYHNILNTPINTHAPISVLEMQEQQKTVPNNPTYDHAVEHLNENFEQLVEKLKADTQQGILGLIRDTNLEARNSTLKEQELEVNEMIKQSSIGELKVKLRDYTKDAARNFQRIAVTETSNAIGMGAVDRILADNEDQDPKDVYVYRIPINDAALCPYCRKFYLDGDGSPAVYRLTTLLSNGTNYGKKTTEWKPVAGATHPNERCSGILQLRPGWVVKPGGALSFVGQENWKTYISNKLRA